MKKSWSKQVTWIRHCLKLKIISSVVFEKHCPLLSYEPWESKMGLNYEFNLIFIQPFAQFMKLIYIEYDTHVRNWYVMLINVVAVLLRRKLLPHKVHSKLMVVKGISDKVIWSIKFSAPYNFYVEFVGSLKRIGEYCNGKLCDWH